MIAASLSLRSPLPTRPMTSTRSSSPLLMAVLFNETSPAGGLSLRGHFYRVFKGTLSKSFNISPVVPQRYERMGKRTVREQELCGGRDCVGTGLRPVQAARRTAASCSGSPHSPHLRQFAKIDPPF